MHVRSAVGGFNRSFLRGSVEWCPLQTFVVACRMANAALCMAHVALCTLHVALGVAWWQLVTANGGRFLEAPVAGNSAQAKAKTIEFMCAVRSATDALMRARAHASTHDARTNVSTHARLRDASGRTSGV